MRSSVQTSNRKGSFIYPARWRIRPYEVSNNQGYLSNCLQFHKFFIGRFPPIQSYPYGARDLTSENGSTYCRQVDLRSRSFRPEDRDQNPHAKEHRLSSVALHERKSQVQSSGERHYMEDEGIYSFFI